MARDHSVEICLVLVADRDRIRREQEVTFLPVKHNVRPEHGETIAMVINHDTIVV